MKVKIVINLIFLILSFIASSESYAQLYSGGPWRGRIIDADTKEPIEGAVVVAIWYREYDTPAGANTYFHEAKEVLTDEGGRFEIPAYVVANKDMHLWRKQDLEKDKHLWPEEALQQWKIIEPLISGPMIREPDFIIYKPTYDCYGDYRCSPALIIFAIGPSMVEYQEFHKEIVKGQEIEWAKKKTKQFPEGLIYGGDICDLKFSSFKGSLPFSVDWFFMTLSNAKDRLEKLYVPLNCPENVEPVPHSPHGYKTDIKNPLKKGGYIVIGLSKVKTWLERIERHEAADRNGDIPNTKVPNLKRILKEEDDYLRPMYKYGRENLNIPIGEIPK